MPYRTWCYCSCMFKKSGSRIKQSEELGKNEETYGTDGGRTRTAAQNPRLAPVSEAEVHIHNGTARSDGQRPPHPHDIQPNLR